MPKVYGSGRFLKDLDFIFDKEYNAYDVEYRIKKAIVEVNNFYPIEYTKSKMRDMLRYNLKIKYAPNTEILSLSTL